jgi:hypothetical protein
MNLPDDGPQALSPDSHLTKFKKETLPLTRKFINPPSSSIGTHALALDRAKMLEEADFFETAHTAAAQSGQSSVPTDLEDIEPHFITFIEAINGNGYVDVFLFCHSAHITARGESWKWTVPPETGLSTGDLALPCSKSVLSFQYRVSC